MNRSTDLKTVPGLRVTVRSFEEADGSFYESWNEALAASAWSHVHQSFEYAVLKNRTGWIPTFVGVETEGKFAAGALLLEMRLPCRFSIAQVSGGPFWRPGAEASLAMLLGELPRRLRSRGLLACRLAMPCPEEVFEHVKPMIPRGARLSGHVWSYWNLSRAAMELDITGSEQDVFRRMHPDTRTKCRRAERRGVQIRAGNHEDIRHMARLLQLTSKRKRIAVRDEHYLRELLRAFPSDRIGFFLAEADGEPIAGLVVAATGRRALYLYGGFDYAKRHLYPMEALYLAMIEWARERNCRVLDLGGTCTAWPPSPGDKGYGVYLFKKRFGAVPFLRAPYCDIVMHPLLYSLFQICEDCLLPLLLESGPARFGIARRRWASRNYRCYSEASNEVYRI